MTETKPKRRRFRFSLRTLLLLVTFTVLPSSFPCIGHFNCTF